MNFWLLQGNRVVHQASIGTVKEKQIGEVWLKNGKQLGLPRGCNLNVPISPRKRSST